jgi:type IV pilus assembly protein PilV
VASRRWPTTATRRDRRGFTLMEVIVALSVFSIGLLGLAAMLPLLKSDLTRSDQRTRAVILAEETAEWLRGLAYEDSSLAAGEHDDLSFGVDRYERSWLVADDDPIAGVKRVAVSVNRVDQPAESATIVFLHAEAGR